jgi:hypothetical protein
MVAAWIDQQSPLWAKSDWWLVAIGVITAGVICWQSWETKRAAQATRTAAEASLNQVEQMKEQTAVAKQAADAALLNAQAIINAERPWLLIKGKFTGDPAQISSTFGSIGISFIATNVGRSPAEIIFAEVVKKHLLSGQEILDRDPFISEGIPDSQQRWTHSTWIGPGELYYFDGIGFGFADAPEVWKDLVGGSRDFYVIGYVRYRDAIAREIHESRFCYRVPIRTGQMVMTGPIGYNKLT